MGQNSSAHTALVPGARRTGISYGFRKGAKALRKLALHPPRIARHLRPHRVRQARIDRPATSAAGCTQTASLLRQPRLPIALKQFGKVRRVRDEPLDSEIGLEAKRFRKLGLGLVLLSL